MTDKIDFGGKPWQALPRELLRDPRLSPRAKGGLCCLLSHEEGWVRSCIAVLMRENHCGRSQAKLIMAELRDLGYAEMSLGSQEGSNLMRTQHTIFAVAQTSRSGADTSHIPTDREPDRPESGATGIRAAVVEALDVEPLDVETLKPLRRLRRRELAT